jgi:hypothetical protein
MKLLSSYIIRRRFPHWRAAKKLAPEQAESLDGKALRTELEHHLRRTHELRFAQQVETWTGADAEHVEALDLATRYAAWTTHSAEASDDRAEVINPSEPMAMTRSAWA